jgi:hypothetical protein
MIFLVFEPKDGLKNAPTLADAERVVFLREKFSWPALLFGPFWLAWHRLWLALLLWIVAFFALAVLVASLKLNETAILAALVVPSLIIAFEATAIRRRKLLRKPMRDAGVVIAQDIEIAERRFFADWAKRAETAAAERPAPTGLVPPLDPSPVLGLFPQPGANR